jgi:energy-coupling factor transporter ATP-binding protein EcfA2
MVRGRTFYAIWDAEAGLWSTDEYDVQRLVDAELYSERDRLYADRQCHVKDLRSFDSNAWTQFKKFCQQISDNSHPLDEKLTFANTEVKKSDYVSRRLPYSLVPGEYPAWEEMLGTLYSVEERQKIEWAIGAVISGDAKKIQKFLVLYGPAGTGKSTILNILQQLFDGYTTTFEAKALGSNNGSFATEAFKTNPLVAIQHDGDLSRIEDNTRLNSIISHEEMTMNEKYKPSYTSRVNAFLFMGTNQPVKISDAKSGIIRRLIDVHPTGVKIPVNHYHTLMGKIDFELGAIAHHCLEVYQHLGKNHYNAYRPLEMMLQTDVFFNFIEAHFDIFKSQDGVSLRQAYALYKEWAADTGIEKVQPQYKFREELRNYFDEFKDREEIDGAIVRSWYSGFNANKFKAPTKEANTYSLVLDEKVSLLDEMLADMPAQLAKEDETPSQRWVNVKTTLRDLDTAKLHYVRVPENHIVIDFDLRGPRGGKDLERNLEAASTWPATYAELSKSGSGVHLHYKYTGNVEELSPIFSDGIEVKVYRGDASLRRMLTKCNAVPVAEIASGLPLKEKKMLQAQTIQSEKGLRDLIARNLRKEIHPGTKPSIDFIKKILDDAYSEGLSYDLTDLRPKIIAFANNSTNQPLQCLKLVQQMKFRGPNETTDNEAPGAKSPEESSPKDSRIVLFDVEVYPNLFVVCWKYKGDANVVRMVNPSPQDVEVFKFKLIGFFNRHYDNHILYARYLGYDNKQLFDLSQKLVNNERHAAFGEAYNISYADILDFSSVKQSLKKFELDLGVHHIELDIPWNEDVPEEPWDKVVEYCVNDVVATEAVLNDRHQDFMARQILADLSGLSVNDTTAKHTAKIIFGDDRQPQKKFVYTDLSEEFPGYIFENGKSYYRDEDPSEGGYVYAEVGYHENVALLDVASMHPTSIEVLNLFGKEYTANYSALKEARIAIKRKQFDKAKKMLDGKLAPYLQNEEDADKLAYALKIVINIVYGLTSAKFDNPFRDIRNVDNIVAKRGALFMIDLKHAVQEQGYTVAHIKTDSIKIADADKKIIDFVTDFGKKYGYEFEHEATYSKMVLVNDAVYIARQDNPDTGETKYSAVGAQFQHPYVYKTLFTKEPITFEDMCEARSVVKGAMYLDIAYDRPLVLEEHQKELQFIGRSGLFIPVREGVNGGGRLYRINDGKSYAVAGTKNFLWMEAETVKGLEVEHLIDMDYFEGLAEDAKTTIEKYTGYGAFVSDHI